MLRLSIKREVKRQVALPIILSVFICCSNPAYSQKEHIFNDSAILKKEIDSVLAKYGLKTKGFIINVISVDQKGGQTAYSITNNYYYGDTINNETNFGFDTSIENGKKWVYVYPKTGVWQTPFIGIDSLKNNCSYDPGPGLVWHRSLWITTEGDSTKRTMILIGPDGACSKNIPMIVGLLTDDAFFIFGDYAEDNKIYLYQKGKVIFLHKNE